MTTSLRRLALCVGLAVGCAGRGPSTGVGSGGAPGGGDAGPGGAGGQAGGAGGGGQGGAAGLGGAGGAAGAGGVAGAPCGAPGLLLCDDFEADAAGARPDPTRWPVLLNGAGTIAVDGTTPAHSGTKSVHVSGADTDYQTFFVLTGAPVFPAPAGRLNVRVFMRLGAPMSDGHNTYFEASVDGMPDAQHETRVGVQVNQLMINQPAGDRGFLSNQNYYTDHLPGVQLPAQAWSCVEVLFDSGKSEVDVWVNDQEVPDLHRTDWQQDTPTTLRFGFEKYAGPGAEIWYDDIAVGTERIGCGR